MASYPPPSSISQFNINNYSSSSNQVSITNSLTSSLNSTTTPLASGATFTGQFELNDQPDVGISCLTDNSGTLFFDFSPDGINVDSTFPPNGFSISSNISEFHSAVKLGRYFRVRLVNSTGAQSFLRLNTYYGKFRQGNLPLRTVVNDDSDCLLVREPYNAIDIVRGNINSVSPYVKFGENTNVSTTLVPISTSGTYQMPTTVQSLEILSSNAGDNFLSGAGARRVVVIGLDSNWLEIEEEIDMNGTTPVALSNQFFRVYRMYVSRSGSYATTTTPSHLGVITLRGSGGGITWAQIPLIGSFGAGQSLISCYTVPADKQLYIKTLTLSSSTTKTASLYVFVRDNANDVQSGFDGALRVRRVYDSIEGTIEVSLEGNELIGPQSDIIISGITSAGSSACSADISGFLINV